MREKNYVVESMLQLCKILNDTFNSKEISRILMDMNKLLVSENLDFIIQPTTYEYKIHEMKKFLIFEKYKDEYMDLEADNINMKLIRALRNMNFQGYRPDKVTEEEFYMCETYDIRLKPIAILYHMLGYAELDEAGKQFIFKVGDEK